MTVYTVQVMSSEYGWGFEPELFITAAAASERCVYWAARGVDARSASFSDTPSWITHMAQHEDQHLLEATKDYGPVQNFTTAAREEFENRARRKSANQDQK